MKKRLLIFTAMVVVLILVLAACGPAATEAPMAEEPAAEEPAAEEPAAEEPAAEEPAVEEAAPVEEEEPMEEAADPNELPRNETLYYNGLQWSAVVGWNPYGSSNNNWIIAEGANARVLMFETPYIFNMLDGQVYPLLADGPYEWNDAQTEITF